MQLIHAESRLSGDSSKSPERPTCNVTVRKGKRRHVMFEDQVEFKGNQSKDSEETGSQTVALPVNL